MVDIKGYEGRYAITEEGKVWSYKRKKWMKTRTSNAGYESINLTDGKRTKETFIHRLVAEAYIPNPDNLPVVNHKDEDKTNNNVSNLEWCTYKYNANYGTRVDRCKEGLKKWHSEHREEHSASIKKSWEHADERRAKASELLKAQNKARFARG